MAQYPLTIAEPSGLSLSGGSDQLWVVSDKSGRIYSITTEGLTLDSLLYKGDDPEGISYDPSNNTLWLVEEQQAQLLHLTDQGQILENYLPTLPQGTPNKGMEGITVDTDQQLLYVLNEDKPGVLLRLSFQGEVQEQFLLSFANDYSGLAYDAQRKALWIISDQSQSINLCNMQGKLIKAFSIAITKAEGVAVDNQLGRIYIVSDFEEVMYVYELKEE